MKIILTKLKRPLTRNDIDFRVGSVIYSNNKAYATILAYKDARTDMKVLDEATDGIWQNEYRRDSRGVLQCGIGIKSDNEWVWKWSNGVESNTEKEKGEYSDAFKRAGFMWGIGRDLYEVPKLFITLKPEEFYAKDGKAKATSKLRPNDWEWEISEDLKTFKATDKLKLVRLQVSESPEEEVETTATETAKPAPRPAQAAPVKPFSGDWQAFALPFGKHKGLTLAEAPGEYLDWLGGEKIRDTELASAMAARKANLTPMTNADLVPKHVDEDFIPLDQIPF